MGLRHPAVLAVLDRAGVLTGDQDAEDTGHLPLAAQLAPRRYRELAWETLIVSVVRFSSPLRPGCAAAAVVG